MPVGKKKSTIKEVHPSNPVPSEFEDTPLPEQRQFHQHLRQEARSVMRAFLQAVLREELDSTLSSVVNGANTVPTGAVIASA
jgi:hypothetical protein